jgi:Ca2+/Na+ antiporter
LQKQKTFGQISGWQLTALVTVTTLVYPLVLLLPQNVVIAIGDEDSIIENAGAVIYLIASVLSLAAYVLSKHDTNKLFARRTKRNVYFLLLALFHLLWGGDKLGAARLRLEYAGRLERAERSVRDEFS